MSASRAIVLVATLVVVAQAQTNFAPHRPDLFRGEIGTGFRSDQFYITFDEETIYSLPFDVPQGIGEAFGTICVASLFHLSLLHLSPSLVFFRFLQSLVIFSQTMLPAVTRRRSALTISPLTGIPSDIPRTDGSNLILTSTST